MEVPKEGLQGVLMFLGVSSGAEGDLRALRRVLGNVQGYKGCLGRRHYREKG